MSGAIKHWVITANSHRCSRARSVFHGAGQHFLRLRALSTSCPRYRCPCLSVARILPSLVSIAVVSPGRPRQASGRPLTSSPSGPPPARCSLLMGGSSDGDLRRKMGVALFVGLVPSQPVREIRSRITGDRVAARMERACDALGSRMRRSAHPLSCIRLRPLRTGFWFACGRRAEAWSQA
jgi:hypothetical protein